jgi:sirohydrochlorin cobaltochelatase
MSVALVLAMHGVPPKDFPQHELRELFSIHAQLEHHHGGETDMHRRHAELHAKMRAWPRTEENDPYHAASHWLAGHLRDETGQSVFVGFNEFCGPSVEEAIDLAVEGGAARIVVITTMMTTGGEHSEKDIPGAIDRSREKHPNVVLDYAWPFELPDVAKFLAHHVAKFEKEAGI